MLIRRTLAKPSGHLLMRLTLENKHAAIFLSITLANVDRFAKFFRCWIPH